MRTFPNFRLDIQYAIFARGFPGFSIGFNLIGSYLVISVNLDTLNYINQPNDIAT